MLRLYDVDGTTVRTLDNIENFCITHVSGGLDTLSFELSPKHDLYPYISEEIKVGYDENDYTIKTINKRKTTSTITCQMDLDEWKTGFYEAFSPGAMTPVELLEYIKPSGWKIIDNAYMTDTFSYELEYVTSYDVFLQVQETFDIAYQISKKYKTLTLLYPENATNIGAYFTDELNLTELVYKGTSEDMITRLYAYGKDDLTIESVNNNRKYVENFDYCDKVIAGYWKDEDYTDAASLKTAAEKQLKELAMPERAYTCTVVDLAKTNPDDYGFLTVRLYDEVTLIDREKGTRQEHNIVEYKEYPMEPSRNVVTLSSTPKKIENSIKSISTQITDTIKPGGFLYQAVQNATDLITGQKGGYIVLDPAEKPERILIMDTADKETATKVWQWNLAGLGYSSDGIDGNYGTAITMDGAIVADYITSGTMAFERCYGGQLTLGGSGNGNGVAYVKNSSGSNVVTLNNSGIAINGGSINLGNGLFSVSSAGVMSASSGAIGGWTLNTSAIYRTSSAFGNSSGMYFGSSGLSVTDKFTVTSAGALTATSANISGKITTTSGTIGGWSLTSNSLYRGSSSYGASDGMYFGKSGLSISDTFEISSSGTIRVYDDSASSSSRTKFVIYDSNNDDNHLLLGTYGAYWEYNSANIMLHVNDDGEPRVSLFSSTDNNIMLLPDGTSYFDNHIYVWGNLTVKGLKNRVVGTQDYGSVLQYCYEMASPYFGDVGEGMLADDGMCYVDIDSVFSETVSATHNYQVFVQKYTEGDITSIERQNSYFIITGTPGLSFAWEIKAKQEGFTTERMENYDLIKEKFKDKNYESAFGKFTDLDYESILEESIGTDSEEVE